VNAFFNGVFLFDLQPFVKKVIVNLNLYGNAFVAFLRRFVPLLGIVTERTFI